MTAVLELASEVEGTVHLLHVVEQIPGAHRGEGISPDRALEDLVERARGDLVGWRGEAQASPGP